MKFKRYVKALFSPRKKDAVGRYIGNISTIEKLIEKDLLYIDVKKPYVALSLRLHLAYMDDEYKLNTIRYRLLRRMGLVDRDARYRSLLGNILAYVNYRRGLLDLPVHAPDRRLDFLVMNMENSRPLLVGVYQAGEVDYRCVES